MSIYRIKGPWAGTLSIVSRPRGGDWLEPEISSWKDAKLNAVLSLLTRDEEAEFELLEERKSSEQQGLRFLSLPIPDLGIPSSRKETLSVLSQIENLLVTGKNVGIHCRQSVGRSGMIAASLLVMSGLDPQEAVESVTTDRGLLVPETEEQRRWVIEVAREFEPSVAQG